MPQAALIHLLHFQTISCKVAGLHEMFKGRCTILCVLWTLTKEPDTQPLVLLPVVLWAQTHHAFCHSFVLWASGPS